MGAQGNCTPVTIAFIAVDGGKEWVAEQRSDALVVQATLVQLLKHMLQQVRGRHLLATAAIRVFFFCGDKAMVRLP